ncbi:MAG: hypothetical protein ACREUC_05630 [Steroidobacteraceae bacterium]
MVRPVLPRGLELGRDIWRQADAAALHSERENEQQSPAERAASQPPAAVAVRAAHP